MLATVPLNLIEVGDRLRSINEDHVAAVAASIAEVGLLNPITVFRKQVVRANIFVDGYGVIAGAHRVEAVRRLGHTDVAAQVMELSDLQRQLAECDENLCSTKLTPAERAIFTQRRKDAYEALHPETKQGAIGRGRERDPDSGTLSFVDDTAARTGRSKSSVAADATRAKHVPEDVLRKIQGGPLDTGVALDRLAREPSPAAQLAAIKREQELAEAHKRNKDSDKLIAMQRVDNCKEWLAARLDVTEMNEFGEMLAGICDPLSKALLREAA